MRWAPALAILLVAGCGGSKQSVPAPPMHCNGSGTPTVVLENGLGQSEDTWDRVRPNLAKLTRVCSYDRPGNGDTEPLPEGAVRTVRDQADTLDDALEAAKVEPPYVLVGHSWGGAIVQLYASQHRDDVAAVVLVDSSHADTLSDWIAALPPAPANDVDPLAQVRSLLEAAQQPDETEHLDRKKSERQLHGVELGSTPLVVVTAATSDLAAALPPALAKKVDAIWRREQDELAALSDDSVHALAAHSGHFVQNDQPELVLAAVKAAVTAARSRELAPCRSIFPARSSRCLG